MYPLNYSDQRDRITASPRRIAPSFDSLRTNSNFLPQSYPLLCSEQSFGVHFRSSLSPVKIWAQTKPVRQARHLQVHVYDCPFLRFFCNCPADQLQLQNADNFPGFSEMPDRSRSGLQLGKIQRSRKPALGDNHYYGNMLASLHEGAVQAGVIVFVCVY